jgi:hypothetical protein
MKTRYILFISTACLIVLTLLDNTAAAAERAKAKDMQFTVKQCGVASVSDQNLIEGGDSLYNAYAFSEKGTLSSTTATQSPPIWYPRWEGILYSCNGIVVHYTLGVGPFVLASGICRFMDNDGNSIISDMTSGGKKISYRFHNGTGSWIGVTGSGTGDEEMPFAGETCRNVTMKIRIPAFRPIKPKPLGN